MISIAICLAITAGDAPADHEPAGVQATHPTNSVSIAGTLPRGVTSFGSIVDGGWLYTLGGFFGTPHAYDSEGQSAAFRRMNLADGAWQELPSPGPMQSVALVAHGGYVYRIGGMVVHNGPHEDQDLRSQAEFARFDPLTGDWYSLPDLPAPRSSHMATVVGDQLFVAGGWRLGGLEGGEARPKVWHETMLVYDLGAQSGDGTWVEVDQPFERRALGVAAFGGRVYAMGGMDSDSSISESVDVYDPSNGTWTLAPEFPESGFGMAGVGTPHGLFASGSSGVVYRLAEEGWEMTASLTYPRFFHQWVQSSEASLLAVGGVGVGARVVHIEELDLGVSRAEVDVDHWKIPYPGDGPVQLQALMRGNDLYVLGRTSPEGETTPSRQWAGGYRLDLGNMKWKTMSDAPVDRPGGAAFVGAKAKSAVFLGGSDHAKEPAESALIYDTRMDMWSEVPVTLPASFRGFSTVEREGDLWMAGGESVGDPVMELRRAHLDGEALLVETVDVRIPNERSESALATLGDSLYMVGGRARDGGLVHACDAYDFGGKEWSEIAEPTTHRIGAQLVALGGKLYLAGGTVFDSEGEPVSGNPLEVYDPEADHWTVLVEDLPVSAEGLSMFPFRDRLLLVSPGESGEYVELILLDVGQYHVAPRDSSFHG